MICRSCATRARTSPACAAPRATAGGPIGSRSIRCASCRLLPYTTLDMIGVERSKPDFSGEYVLNRSASTLSAAGAASVESSRVRIEHQEPSFRSEFAYVFSNGQRFEGTFELTTDGREVAGVEHG